MLDWGWYYGVVSLCGGFQGYFVNCVVEVEYGVVEVFQWIVWIVVGVGVVGQGGGCQGQGVEMVCVDGVDGFFIYLIYLELFFFFVVLLYRN